MGPMGGPGDPFSYFFEIVSPKNQTKIQEIQKVNFWGENQSCSRRNSAHFGTHTVSWGPLNDSFPDFQFFPKLAAIAISDCSGSPPPGIAISGVRGFGYDYDYGYGYVKSVDSMDNVNSVRSADNVNSMDNVNSAVICRCGGAAGMKGALLVLLTLSRPLPQRTLLTLSMLSTLLT